MLTINITNIILNDVLAAVVTIFKDFAASGEILEGGLLNRKTYRIGDNGYIWAKAIDLSENSIGTLSIEIATGDIDSKLAVVRACDTIRLIRDYFERSERSNYINGYGTVPVVESFTLSGEVNKIIVDEISKVITPTTGFSEKSFILNNPGEPFFVLMGRDLQAPALLEDWALTRRYSPEVSDKIKAADALDIARSMRSYRIDNPEVGIRHAVLQTALETREKASSNFRTKDVATPVA